MQANIHTPERLSGESQKYYKERRAQSKRAIERMTLSGPHTSGTLTSRQALRDEQRKTGTMGKIAGRYGRGLQNQFNNRPSKGRI